MRLLLLLAALTAVQGIALAQALTERERQEVIIKAKNLIEREYVDPDRAGEIAGSLDSVNVEEMDQGQFARSMQRLLRDVSGDKHFEVFVERDGASSLAGKGRTRNYGFSELKILKGNVGYLRLSYFEYPEQAAAVAQGAMSFLANSDAVIIDLRDNNGGSKAMAQLILSYFFDAEPIHMFSVFGRHDQYYYGYTEVSVPGIRMPDLPLYVLQNRRSFSAAEMFAFVLQNHKRAVLVGETTAGGGHTVGRFSIGDGLSINIPVGRVVDPTTGEGWEGVGVKPDIEAEGERALQRAYLLALQEKRTDTTAADIFDVNWQYDILKTSLEPVVVNDSLMRKYAGSYERRIVRYDAGKLYYQARAGIDPALMIPVDDSTFRFDEAEFFRVRFVRNAAGETVGLKGMYDDGFADYSSRTE